MRQSFRLAPSTVCTFAVLRGTGCEQREAARQVVRALARLEDGSR